MSNSRSRGLGKKVESWSLTPFGGSCSDLVHAKVGLVKLPLSSHESSTTINVDAVTNANEETDTRRMT